MNTPDLEELERLLANATPGEWQHHMSHVYGPDPERELICKFRNGPWLVSDRDLIVALKNTAPSLITKAREADELRAEVAANSAAAAKQVSDLAMQVGELRAEVGRLRICVGLHVNADAYADTFPEDAEDAAQLRKSETWHRLSARSVLLERDKDVCNQAAKAWLLKPGGDPAAAFAAARAALGEAK